MPLPQKTKKIGRNEVLKGERLVRIKKRNPRRGLKLGEYSARWKGRAYDFTQSSGWTRVPVKFAEYLATLPSTQGVLAGAEGDEDAPRAFWVASTIAEAEKIDERERKEEEKRNSPRDAVGKGDLRVSDLRSRRRFDDDEDDEEEEDDDEEEEDEEEEDDDSDEETREIDAKIAELKQRKAEVKERKASAPAATRERSIRVPKDDEREAEPEAEEHEEEHEEEEPEQGDGNPDINDDKPAAVDFGKDPKDLKAAPAKRAPAKRAAKKASNRKGRGKNR